MSPNFPWSEPGARGHEVSRPAFSGFPETFYGTDRYDGIANVVRAFARANNTESTTTTPETDANVPEDSVASSDEELRDSQ
jgi:hypothetical protein